MIYNINMKKLLTSLLILLMVFTLVGCNSKEETSAVQELEQKEVIEKIEEETEIAGGYVDVEDGTLTDELKDIFSKALEGLTGAKYEPVELVATQVVAGTNYKFLANGTKTTNPVTKGTYYIIIYKDLQGNVELLDIETIEEKQEVIKEETKKEVSPEVLKTYNYWVVFYDQDGNELQREAIKYGATPTYWSDTPYYEDGENWYRFVGWTDRWGRDVTEFKPITGNTKYYAKYEIGGKISHSSGGGGGSNPPAPPAHVCSKSSTYLLYITSVSLPFDIYADVYEWDATYGGYIKSNSDYYIDGLSFNPIPSGAGIWIHTNDRNTPFMGNQQACDDYEAHLIDPCFIAGTQVQYDLLGHTKSIENFKVGDQVVSYNVNTNTYYLAKVGKVFVHDGKDRVNLLADVTLEDGTVITMTPNHPVYTTAGFKAIDNDHRPQLKEGQFVMTADGWTQIKEIDVYSCEPTVTYNLGLIDYDEIVDNDTYDTYVAGGIVVHNIK